MSFVRFVFLCMKQFWSVFPDWFLENFTEVCRVFPYSQIRVRDALLTRCLAEKERERKDAKHQREPVL